MPTGKKFSKTVRNPKTGRKKTVRYGAKGYTIAPGTKRGDSYCARSLGIRSVFLRRSRTTQTVLTIYHAASGNVAVLNHGENDAICQR